ncbi:MAG: 4Fe-4S binding protein [Thermoanaerobaculia bacterium]|nr:4Fe-4S binding protein [Thermoanaerobaculia bacterium]
MTVAGEPASRTTRRRIDWRRLDRRATVPFVAFVLVTWAVAGWIGSRRPEPDLLPFLKRAWPAADFARLPSGAWEVRRGGVVAGHAAWGRGTGYGGAIVVAVGTDAGGAISSAAFLEYRDTPDLLRSTRALLASLLGRGVGAPLELGRDVDAVTGATFSAAGVVEATRAALRTLPAGGATASDADPPIVFGAAEIALLALMAGGVAASRRTPLRGRALAVARGATQLASLATIGFLFDRPWVIAFPLQLAAGTPPPWRANLFGYLLLAYLLLVFARSGRGPYCPWLCPFGAAQDVVGRLGGAAKRPLPAGRLFTWLKRLLLWLAVLLGLAHRSPGAASYEIFGTAFRVAGSGFQIALLVVVALVSLRFARPFCHWLCPVDVQERLLRSLRRRRLGRLAVGRRPSPLPVLGDPPPRDTLRRLRDGALTAVGLVAVALTLAHLGTRFAALGGEAERGRMSETFVAAAAAR